MVCYNNPHIILSGATINHNSSTKTQIMTKPIKFSTQVPDPSNLHDTDNELPIIVDFLIPPYS